MNTPLFQGKLVCLKGRDPELFAASLSRWGRDSEFQRLLDSDTARARAKKALQEEIEKDLEGFLPVQRVICRLRERVLRKEDLFPEPLL